MCDLNSIHNHDKVKRKTLWLTLLGEANTIITVATSQRHGTIKEA